MKQSGPGDATERGIGRCSWCAALQVLGLKTSASDSEIRSAHRLLAQVWHPDRFQTNQKLREAAEEKLKEINRAYQFLTSPQGQSARCDGAHGVATAAAAEAASPPPYHSESYEPEQRSQSAAPPRARRRLIVHSGILLRYCLILACATVVGFLVLQRLDSYLDSNPATSRFYGETKARVSADAAQTVGGFWNRIRRGLRLAPPSRPAPSAAMGSESQVAPETPSGQATHVVRPQQPAVMKVRPYITADLTQQEVELVQGPPTEATENKLVYQRSELYFRANHLIGWKIDPSAPLRVKLWPDSNVPPGLQTFTLGSSKDEVLVVQGTPSLFSDNTFGYGRSEVYFENNRVVGWKNDPATVPLRVTIR